ncbi:MAG TPA: DNA-binding response regulator [Cryomorphaceae bacterium]|nr:DNA-binding response regulator [Owenweeksia sp.]HAD97292.1 DNA-binding response regulator [Cryomorphaceae bacterium]HBF19905.1 DNA-binding response regulator [Cryomorphaceae bacterium]|tara:strand:+ start:479 stop:1174 length:696 start_codon:yes stop_codon:yes gene_type:complete
MNKVRCLIIDDEPIARRVVRSYLQNFSQFEILEEFGNSYDTILYLAEHEIDLLFLDIKMPGLNGLDFLETLSPRPKVIIITAYRDYALQGFELEVADYLLKPVSEARFIKALKKVERELTPADDPSQNIVYRDYLLIKAHRKTYKIPYPEIEMIESRGDNIIVFYQKNRLEARAVMSNLEKELPHYFLRTHRSFIINTHFVSAFTAEEAELENHCAPIGRSYRNEVLKALN